MNAAFAKYVPLIENRLDALLADPSFDMPALLRESMRYSALGGGKRLRGAMLLAAVECLGGRPDDALDFACAVEMIHAYSLVHDDLPGMDDDVLRRGKPTNHVVYGVGQAILAGDGLLNFAAEVMLRVVTEKPENAYRFAAAMREIMTGAGITGMIAGQCLDLDAEKTGKSDEALLKKIHYGKTACMFVHPLRAACRITGREEALAAMTRYGRAFGELFQATDDILDVEGDEAALGKSVGKDAASGKTTYVSLYGLEGAKTRCIILASEARSAAGEIGGLAPFRDLIQDMLVRKS